MYSSQRDYPHSHHGRSQDANSDYHQAIPIPLSRHPDHLVRAIPNLEEEVFFHPTRRVSLAVPVSVALD
ncbi:hypothetical protein CCP4SC76_7790003 [Gammaproteobacteria bacterium]